MLEVAHAADQCCHLCAELSISGNNMTGDVPLVLFTLPYVQSLKLSHNAYTGWAAACDSALTCTCSGASSALFSLYHKQVPCTPPDETTPCVDSPCSASNPSGCVQPPGDLFDSTLSLDIRYNILTSLPLYALRMFHT
jgi:hypothetical protein